MNYQDFLSSISEFEETMDFVSEFEETIDLSLDSYSQSNKMNQELPRKLVECSEVEAFLQEMSNYDLC